MKTPLAILRNLLLGLILFAVIFYFWGSSPNWTEERREQLITYPGASVRPYAAGDTLRVMTYNIGYLSGMANNSAILLDAGYFESNLTGAIRLITSHQPDLIGLQEADYYSRRSFDQHQANEIASAAGYFGAFHSVNWDKRYVPFPYGLPQYNFGRIVSGQSLLSRFALANARSLVLDKPHNTPFYYNAFYLDRMIQQADWIVGPDTVKVMNLHLEAFDRETRLVQAQKVKEEYLKVCRRYPVLILGDFNSEARFLADDAMRIIMDAPDIRSAISREQYEQNPEACYTFSSAKPVYMIDYILYNASFISPVGAWAGQDAGEISDHLPVFFDFVLKN